MKNAKLDDRVNKMKISGTPEDWHCLCGNTALASSFHPCNGEGTEVEPTPEEWTTNWYVCEQCGRIIDNDTMEVKGVRFSNTLTMNELLEHFPNG
jgi:hypothetical protein